MFDPEFIKKLSERISSLGQFQFNIEPELLKRAQEGIRRYTEISATGFVELAKCGWYINGGISLGESTYLMELALNKKLEEIYNYLCNYYRSALEEWKIGPFSKYKGRGKIIQEAVDCHLEMKYFASTSLFLSQADGICSGMLFKTKAQKKDLKELIARSKSGSFFNELLSAILERNAIDSLYSQMDQYDSQLNRHGVMHGYDIDFGTELSSLKAYSLLSFVSDFVTSEK